MAPAFKLVYFELTAKGLSPALAANFSGLEWAGRDEPFAW